MNYWETILLMSSVCLGWRMITDDHKLLNFVRTWALAVWNPKTRYILDPLIICCACMASVWGSIVFWSVYLYFNGLSWPSWTQYPIWVSSCLITSFLNGFAWALYELVRKY